MIFDVQGTKFNVNVTIPSDTQNHDLTLAVMRINRALNNMTQLGLAHFITGLRNSVNHQIPAVRSVIQSNVTELGEGLGLLYVFSIWDHFTDPLPRPDVDDLSISWMTSDERLRFQAYRHVRHSMAHAFAGTRARDLRPEFEQIMQSSNPLSGVKWDSTNDTIDLSHGGAAMQCHFFMENLTKLLLGRLANNKLP